MGPHFINFIEAMTGDKRLSVPGSLWDETGTWFVPVYAYIYMSCVGVTSEQM
jgi:hypothetical protein